MEQPTMQRRRFLQSMTAAGLTLSSPAVFATESDTLAVKGGTPVRKDPFPSWPILHDGDDEVWLDVLHKKGWCRLSGGYVTQFEKGYAQMMGVKDCVAVSNGTNALFGSMSALEIGPGDEVLVPPYTFVATINVPFLLHALPVFVDTDPETFQMNPDSIETKITNRTRAICPVHLGGNVCDMDRIMAIAKKHNLFVIEDTCQSHLAEWRGQKAGSIGDAGCFSFQVTKNLSSGEGGAIISNNIDLMDRVFSFHTNGRERVKSYGYHYVNNGTNMRMTEFQGALLLQGMKYLREQADTRTQNAEYLSRQLKEIPGITPAKMYEGCTRNAYHLYMFRYDSAQFAHASKDQFIKALSAEGVPCTSGYSPLNKEPLIEKTLRSRAYQAVYSKERIDQYMKENECPANDRLCKEEAVWFTQNVLLGTQGDMDQIAAAIRKIQGNASSL